MRFYSLEGLLGFRAFQAEDRKQEVRGLGLLGLAKTAEWPEQRRESAGVGQG